jgi:chemotaxis protein CheY-P-specific phosphatase CheC
MENVYQENYIIHALNNGFKRAADSFSQLMGKKVRITNAQSILIRHNNKFSYISEEEGELFILVTQVIGDISGKSYLVFSSEEVAEVSRSLKATNSKPELTEAFLLEIDNIISASVIADLSNALHIELYRK